MSRARRKRARIGTGQFTTIPKVKLVNVSINDIQPYENNPRDNADAIPMIARSIQTFGFVQPVLLSDAGVLIAGHTRYEAAKILGLTEIPAIYASHLTGEQADAFRIIDNKLAEAANWDNKLLSVEISALNNIIDFTDYGYTQEEVDCLHDVVADDCLEAGVAVGEGTASARNEARAPSRTRFVVGEFIFYADNAVYRQWANQIRTECDFSESAVQAHLKQLLGISNYEED